MQISWLGGKMCLGWVHTKISKVFPQWVLITIILSGTIQRHPNGHKEIDFSQIHPSRGRVQGRVLMRHPVIYQHDPKFVQIGITWKPLASVTEGVQTHSHQVGSKHLVLANTDKLVILAMLTYISKIHISRKTKPKWAIIKMHPHLWYLTNQETKKDKKTIVSITLKLRELWNQLRNLWCLRKSKSRKPIKIRNIELNLLKTL